MEGRYLRKTAGVAGSALAPLPLLLALAAALSWSTAAADEVYLTLEEAPAAVFTNADRFERHDLVSTPELRERIAAMCGRIPPSFWEPAYPVFDAWRGDTLLGRAVVVEEIGKHRNITFVVGIAADRSVAGVAVMVYREAYGGEVRSSRFLAQYDGKTAEAPLMAGRDLRNISGATLSVNAIGRGVKKALAIAGAAGDESFDAEATAGK